MSTTERTWQDNAAEFALLDKGEGWPFARLIACSVERSRPGPKGDRNDRSDLKVSATEFSEKAGTSRPRIIRYLDAWDKAAKQGLCTPSTDLSPADAPTVMEPDIAWGEIYDASKAGGRPRDSKPSDAAAIIGNAPGPVIEAMTPLQRVAMADALKGRERADRKTVEDEIIQGELERGVDGREAAALRDQQEAHLHLVQRLLEVSYGMTQVISEWRQYREFLTTGDLREIAEYLTRIENNLGVLRMYATDDVVGEVLNHE